MFTDICQRRILTRIGICVLPHSPHRRTTRYCPTASSRGFDAFHPDRSTGYFYPVSLSLSLGTTADGLVRVPSQHTPNTSYHSVSTIPDPTLNDSLDLLPNSIQRKKGMLSCSNLETGFVDGNLTILNSSQHSIDRIIVNSQTTSLQLLNITKNSNNPCLFTSCSALLGMLIWPLFSLGNVIPISSDQSMRSLLPLRPNRSKLPKRLLGLVKSRPCWRLRTDDWSRLSRHSFRPG